jgi:hypothetical protein
MSVEFFGLSTYPKAIVIRASEKIQGIEFFSPPEYSQQIGLMTRQVGYIVPAHVHNKVERVITSTQEVLILRRGNCLVTLFNGEGESEEKIYLNPGDAILLAHGAHKIEMLSECEILEIKQGPYAGKNDKTQIKVIP